MGAGGPNFFTVAIPEAGGGVLAQVRAMRKTDIIRRLFFCADVVGGLPLFALAMPLVSCSREKRLFGI